MVHGLSCPQVMWGPGFPALADRILTTGSAGKMTSPFFDVCMCVLVAKSCPTVCDPMDCSPLGSSVHGILQANSPGLILHIRPMNLPNIFRTICPNTFFPSICGTFGTTEHILGHLGLQIKSQ